MDSIEAVAVLKSGHSTSVQFRGASREVGKKRLLSKKWTFYTCTVLGCFEESRNLCELVSFT